VSDHEWYRRTSWTEQDRTDFYNRLKLSRNQFQKAQCARIQAHYLGKVDAEAALTLLDQVIDEWPEPSQLAQAYFQKAECFIRLGRKREALKAFFESFEEQRIRPNWQTNAFLDFGLFVIKNRMTSLYDKAEQVLDEFWSPVLLPIHRYKLHAIRAVTMAYRRDRDGARFHANCALDIAALEHSGLHYHPEQGLVGRQDPWLEDKLRRLAKNPPLN
jgi:tetratricopeptide (TPR) repeat protein